VRLSAASPVTAWNKSDVRSAPRNPTPAAAFSVHEEIEEANMGRGLLLWLIGVPIPVIILLWLFFGR
jgi:hypothetical protein